MIICRRCRTPNADEAAVTCTRCGADLRREGVRPAAGVGEMAGSGDLPSLEDLTTSLDSDDVDAPAAVEPVDDPPAAAPTRGHADDGGWAVTVPPSSSAVGTRGPPATPGTDPPGTAWRREPRDDGGADPSPAPPSGADPFVVRSVQPSAEAGAGGRPAANVWVAGQDNEDDRPNVVAEDGEPVEAAPAPDDAAPGPRQLRAGEIACTLCFEPNPESRRFCHLCGTQLPAYAVEEMSATDEGDDELDVPGDNWWRRLTGRTVAGGQDRRTWNQKARDRGAHRLRGRLAISTQTRGRAALAALGLVGIGGLAFFGPLRGPISDLLSKEPESVLPTAVVLESADEVAGAVADNVRDPDESTFVALRWNASRSETEGWLRLEFDPAIDVDDLYVLSGRAPPADESPNEEALFPRVRLLEVCRDRGVECKTFEVGDGSGRQVVDPALDDVGTLYIRVVGLHDQIEWAHEELVLLREIGVL